MSSFRKYFINPNSYKTKNTIDINQCRPVLKDINSTIMFVSEHQFAKKKKCLKDSKFREYFMHVKSFKADICSKCTKLTIKLVIFFISANSVKFPERPSTDTTSNFSKCYINPNPFKLKILTPKTNSMCAFLPNHQGKALYIVNYRYKITVQKLKKVGLIFF